MSTSQVNLPRSGPTIAPSNLSLASNPPPCRVHRWGGRSLFPIWLPVVSWCITLWDGAPHSPLPPLLRGTPTLRLPHVLLSSPWSVMPPGGGTPPGPWASLPSPPSSCWCTRAPTAPPPYTSLPGPAPFLLSLPAPSLPFLIASDIFRRFWYTPNQSLLLYMIVWPRYGNVYNGGRASALIWNDTLLSLKHYCRVLRLSRLSSPCLHFSYEQWRVFSLPNGTCLPQRSHLGRGLRCSSSILTLAAPPPPHPVADC